MYIYKTKEIFKLFINILYKLECKHVAQLEFWLIVIDFIYTMLCGIHLDGRKTAVELYPNQNCFGKINPNEN